LTGRYLKSISRRARRRHEGHEEKSKKSEPENAGLLFTTGFFLAWFCFVLFVPGFF